MPLPGQTVTEPSSEVLPQHLLKRWPTGHGELGDTQILASEVDTCVTYEGFFCSVIANNRECSSWC